MLPSDTGILTSPAVSPVESVVITVLAITGPAASVNPLASVVVRKPRRFSVSGGSRLSYSGFVCMAISGNGS